MHRRSISEKQCAGRGCTPHGPLTHLLSVHPHPASAYSAFTLCQVAQGLGTQQGSTQRGPLGVHTVGQGVRRAAQTTAAPADTCARSVGTWLRSAGSG